MSSLYLINGLLFEKIDFEYPQRRKTSQIHQNEAKNCFENEKKLKKFDFFQFFQNQF